MRLAPAGALACALLVSACGGGETGPRSAVLITMDTTRRDAITCFGGPPGVTPFLDALAEESVLYLEARTVAPITLPSHASMLTGLYPPRHTVRDNSLTPLPQAATTLAELARERGLRTGAVIAALVLTRAFGLDQGFEEYTEPARQSVPGGQPFGVRSADQVTDAALEWLGRRDPDQPYLLWVHYFDPHKPYYPGQAFKDQVGGDPYLASVARMDASIGRLLEALRAEPDFDETLVVVVADHGEGLGEHDEDTHAAFVYDTTIRVPFLIRYPDGYGAGERRTESVSVTDVYPTLVEALALGNPGDVDGQSLYRRTVAPDRGVYFESYYGLLYYQWSPLAGWADADGKYVHSSAPEFYATDSDPHETANLIAERAGDVERYRAELRRLAQRDALDPADSIADRSIVEDLQALGYAGLGGAGDLPDPLDAGDGASPHARPDELRMLVASWNHATRGEHDAAVRLLELVVAESPRNHDALARLGKYLLILERYEEGIAALERFVKVGPPWPEPYRNLGLAYEKVGNDDKAIEWLLRALEVDPDDKQALPVAIALLEAAGRSEDAAPLLKRWEELR